MQKNVWYAVIVVAVVIVIAGAYMFTSSGGSPSSLVDKPVSVAQLSQLEAIALDSTLANNVGAGSTTNGGHPNYPTVIDDNALVINGKVGVVYISADFCPYCAINRWGLIIALMRFGNFTGLQYMQSGASPEIYPSTSTFTFSNSSYSSSNIYFDAVETASVNGSSLGTPDALQTSLLKKYDKGGSIPFTDFGNRSVLVGSVASPQSLQGSDWTQIIAQLNNTNSPISQSVIGSANIFTAYICRTGLGGIGNESACKQAYVRNINGA